MTFMAPDYIEASSNPPLFYRTKDLYEAASIHAHGLAIINVENEGDICYFTFDNKDACEKIVLAFRNRTLCLNAKTFVESIKTMKDFIYQHKRNDRRDDGRN